MNKLYYRILYSDIGIYEALKKELTKSSVGRNIWKEFLKNNDWLSVPNVYLNKDIKYNSYFTEAGYEKFLNSEDYILICKFLDQDKIKINRYILNEEDAVYKDIYQAVFVKNKLSFDNSILWHGSHIQGLKVLIPKRWHVNEKIEYKAIFTSPVKTFAACYGGIWSDDIAKQGSWDGFKNTVFGVTDKVEFSNPCSLYEIENDETGIELHPQEIVFDHPIKVKNEIKYNSFKDMLIQNGVIVTTRDEYIKAVGTNKHPKFSNYFNENNINIPNIIRLNNKSMYNNLYNQIINPMS